MNCYYRTGSALTFLSLCISSLTLVWSSDVKRAAPGPNIALGKSYTFDKTTQTTAFEPNWGTALDPEKVKLTDGQLTNAASTFWSDKSAAGWQRQPTVSVTIDLKTIEPIAGISYSTAADSAGNINFPVAISLFVSDDGQAFFYVGDVVRLSVKHGVPDESKYTAHRFVADKLTAKGRYVRLLVRAGSGGNTFCDEIEVYRGNESLLAQAHQGESIAAANLAAMEALSQGMQTDAGVRRRLRKDLAGMQQRVSASNLQASEKQTILKRLTSLMPRIEELPQVKEEGFRATIPLNDLHAEILRSNAPILRRQGVPPMLIWQNNPLDPLELLEVSSPPSNSPSEINVAMINKEYRSAAFNITNTTDKPQVITLHVDGLPAGSEDRTVSIYQVEFVDTGKGTIVADPLVPAQKTKDGYVVNAPAGLTRQVWLTFHPQDLKDGTYAGRISIKASPLNAHRELPLTLKVYPLTFPEQPALSLYMWDYANNGFGNATSSALTDMRAHYLDTAWGNADVVPALAPSDVDEHGNLINQPNFSAFDAWVKLWQGRGIRHYMVGFSGSQKDFAGKAFGTPEFKQAVGRWADAWANHNAKLGLKPGQVAVNVLDEPSTSEQGQRFAQWANAIKAGTSQILIFMNPVDTEDGALQDVLPIADILCPNLGVYAEKMPKIGAAYKAMLEKGKTLWFYSCSGPVALMDPYYYYRLQAWFSWKHGATGSGFWAYYDAGGSSAWNPYTAVGASFTPVYIDETMVTTGKHWEAVREGVEDYEYLHMLAGRIADLRKQGKSSKALDEATQLLSALPEEVTQGNYDQTNKAYPWDKKDRSSADRARHRILASLDRLRQD